LACERKEEDGTIVKQQQWVINIGGKAEDCSSTDTGKRFCVTGGLVVPLYFVVLALIGGAVSLTRRVPEYQKRSASSYVGTEKEPKLNAPTAREYLVFQIVQFISASLIAAVAYYLIAPETRTAGVAVAFTSGFGSEAILLMIRGVVEKVSPGTTTVPQTGAVSGVVSKQRQGMAGITLKVVGKAKLTGQTDDYGHFVIHDIPAADQVIEASGPAAVTKLARVTIDPGKTSVCHIEFP
jgi:hypothetical protein